MKRVIQQQLQNPLATDLLKGNYPAGTAIRVDAVAGEFVIQHGETSALQTSAG